MFNKIKIKIKMIKPSIIVKYMLKKEREDIANVKRPDNTDVRKLLKMSLICEMKL